jgi:hypothetical protein
VDKFLKTCRHHYFSEIMSVEGLFGGMTSLATLMQGNWVFLIIGIILIAITIAILYFLKQIIVNSLVGVVAWVIITYALPLFGLNLSLPFLPSLVVSAIFGLAGIGALMVIAFLGLI